MEKIYENLRARAAQALCAGLLLIKSTVLPLLLNLVEVLLLPGARPARPWGLTVYPPWIQIRDVAAAISQSCDRKSKFGLRHVVKLILAYYHRGT